MKISDIIATANKNLLRNKVRTLLTVLAILIGSFSIITTIAMNDGVNKFIDDQIEAYGGDGMLTIMATDITNMSSSMMPSMTVKEPPEYGVAQTEMQEITDEQIEKIKNIEGIKEDSLVVFHMTTPDYATSDYSDKKYVLTYDILPPGDIHIATTAGEMVSNDSDEYEVMLPSAYVKYYGFESDKKAVGKTLTLHVINQFTNEDTEIKAKIVGIQAPGIITQTTVYINSALESAVYQAVLNSIPDGYREKVDKTYVVAAEYDYKNYTAEEIKDKLDEAGLIALSTDDMVGMIRGFFDAMTIVFTVFGAIALITASIGIVNTLLMSVQERTREIGLDKALGESSSRVFLSFSLEAAMLGFWGSVLGTVCSIIAGKFINQFLHEPGQVLADLPTFNLLSYSWQNIVIVCVVIMFIAFVAGTAPALKAAKKNPIDALRYE